MSILSGFEKVKDRILTSTGYKLRSLWTSAQTVEMDDGTVLQDKIESMDTKIDGKAPSSHTHTATQVTGLTPSMAMVSDNSGHPSVSNVTSTELNYLDGVTSNIQNQIDTLNSKSMMFGAWTGSNIDPLKWTNIMNFQLDAGGYLIMWKCKIGSVQSSNAICGTRIRWGDNQQQELQNHISNQENSMSCFTWVSLSQKTTIYIDFYHNAQNQYPFVSLKQAFVFPVIVDGTLDNQ